MRTRRKPRLLVPASQLTGGAVRFWHDQLFCKPARHGGVVAWHQDYSYWTRSATDEPLLHGVPVIPRGEELSGDFFPLLYDPREA